MSVLKLCKDTEKRIKSQVYLSFLQIPFQLLEQLTLASRKPRRNLHIKGDNKVAKAPLTLIDGETLATEAALAARLRTLGHLHAYTPRQRVHHNLAAQHSSRKGYGHRKMEVVAHTSEHSIGSDAEGHDKVATGTACRSLATMTT